VEEQNKKEFFCTDCKKDINETDLICPHCGADVSCEVEELEDAPIQFKGMLTLGNVLDIIGWIVGAIGAIVIGYVVLNLSFEKVGYGFLLPILLIGLSVFIVALFLIAAGQFLQCQVAVERNGRQTNIMLLKLIEQGKEKKIVVKMNN